MFCVVGFIFHGFDNRFWLSFSRCFLLFLREDCVHGFYNFFSEILVYYVVSNLLHFCFPEILVCALHLLFIFLLPRRSDLGEFFVLWILEFIFFNLEFYFCAISYGLGLDFLMVFSFFSFFF